MLTVLEIIKRTSDFLAGKGVESPRLNAELLVGHALGLKRMQLYLQFERLLTETDLEKIRPLVRRRGAREPIQYIVGETDFGGLKLKVDRRALIPRPETERLVEVLVERLKPAPSRVLDLGTGTGAIALALASAWPEATVTAVDLSADALALAGENAAATGLAERARFVRSDWFAGIAGEEAFGLIVGNPPYLSAEETAETAAEVKDHEPAMALTAADRGLAAIRTILAEAPRQLSPGGTLALETGPAQHAEISRLAQPATWATFESLPDLTGRDRYVLLTRAK